jgi:hypothetical protein
LSTEHDKTDIIKKSMITGTEEEEDDDHIDEESEATDRLLADNYKSPRNKLKRK